MVPLRLKMTSIYAHNKFANFSVNSWLRITSKMMNESLLSAILS